MKINLVLLTGAMRSGTSILGKIIGSFENVDFFYEPMTFLKLLLNKEGHQFIDDYIYYDLMLAALAGRNINLNANDDSSIYNFKTKDFIETRMSRSWGTDVLHEKFPNPTCLIKYPSYIREFSNFNSKKYTTKRAMIIREPNGNILSLLQKKWFSNEVLNSGIRGEFKKIGSRFLPLWLSDTEADQFYSLDEMGRCTFYYIKMASQDMSQYNVVISYKAMCNNPDVTIQKVLKSLDLKASKKTAELISELKPEKVKPLDIKPHNKNLLDEAYAKYEAVTSKLIDE